MSGGLGLGVVGGQTIDVGEEKVHLPKPDKKEVGTHGSVHVGQIRTGMLHSTTPLPEGVTEGENVRHRCVQLVIFDAFLASNSKVETTCASS
jgi:hypothetical protein